MSSKFNESPRRVNLGNVIHLDQIEELLTNLLTRIDNQQRAIDSLSELCLSFCDSGTLTSHITKTSSSINDINERIEWIQKMLMIPVGDSRVSVREIAAENMNQIKTILDTIPLFAKKTSMAKGFEELQQEFHGKLQDLEDRTTPLELTWKIQDTHESLRQRVHAVETGLQCKLDRSEISCIEELSERLKHYDSFQTETQRHLESLDTLTSTIESQIPPIVKDISALEDRVHRLEDDSKHYALNAELQSLQHDMDGIRKTMSQFALQTTVDKTQARIDAMTVVQENHGNRLEQHASSIEEIRQSLSSKADLTLVKKCVPRTHFEEMITVLGQNVDNKADLCDVAKIDQRLEEVAEELSQESKKVKVAIRFVDWFSQRGQNYEHNLKVLDKHLHNLTQGSVESIQNTPFSPSIRLTDNWEVPQ